MTALLTAIEHFKSFPGNPDISFFSKEAIVAYLSSLIERDKREHGDSFKSGFSNAIYHINISKPDKETYINSLFNK